jgi:tetratricopeptide (TPR) repeat protein
MPAHLAELCKQIDKSPKNSDLYQLRAEYYYITHKLDKALADILQAIKINDQKSSYYVTLADIYFSQSETDLVEETLNKAIALDNNNEAFLKLAELYLYQYMYKECEETLEKALRLQTHNPKAFLTKAFMLIETGDTVGSLRMMQLAIDQNPREVIAHTFLAEFFQKELDPIAISYFKNALEISPNDKLLNYNFGRLLQDLGELELAKEQYQNLIALDPRSYPAFNNLGYIALVHEDNYEEAVHFFTKSIEIDSLYAQAWCNRGIAYEYLNEWEKARVDFRRCIKIDPEYQSAVNRLNELDKMRK